VKPVPVAVVGLGFMGARWARVLAEHPLVELKAVSDIREDLGRQTAEQLGVRFLPDPLETASDPDVEAVVVCTPEHLHVEPALAAIDAGKAVAVEKPLAHTIQDAERIRAQAEEQDLPVLAAHILRFEARYAAARRAIEAGELGAVQAVRHERVGTVANQDLLQGRTSIGLYYGVHEFDLARWYAGEVERIYAERSAGVLRAHGHEVDDLYSAAFRFVSGAHGTATLGWSLPRSTPGYGMAEVTVFGEHGAIHVVQGDAGLLVVDEGGARHPDAYYAPEVHGRLRGALAAEADHFVDCARGVAEPLCTAADGAEAVRLASAMELSAERGKPVELASVGEATS
jgi:predicted dehydrogenase